MTSVEPRSVISFKELAKHASEKDCWVAVSGKVYDLTSWLPKHPGGKLTILAVAGRDATDVFLAFHALAVKKYLPAFYVADLEEHPLPPLVQDYRQLVKEIEDRGLFVTDYWFYINHIFVLLPLLALVFAGVYCTTSPLVHLLCAATLGMIWNMVSFVGHDTCHNGITKNVKYDTWIGLVAGNLVTGIGIGWWKRTHNVHHILCNSIDYDPDLQHAPILAISNKYFDSPYSFYHSQTIEFGSLARNLVSHQHIYFYPLMAVARINLMLQSLALLCSSAHIQDRFLELVAMAGFWVWFPALIAGIPTTSEKIAFFFTSMAVAGILHVQIVCAHYAMPVFEGRSDNYEFFRTQLTGTQNIRCPVWLDWFWGGLQFQIEHHLFPRLPRHNLRKVMPMVKGLCKKHGVPYICSSFLAANVHLVEALSSAAMEARALGSKQQPCPKLTDSLLWDGLNARG